MRKRLFQKRIEYPNVNAHKYCPVQNRNYYWDSDRCEPYVDNCAPNEQAKKYAKNQKIGYRYDYSPVKLILFSHLLSQNLLWSFCWNSDAWYVFLIWLVMRCKWYETLQYVMSRVIALKKRHSENCKIFVSALNQQRADRSVFTLLIFCNVIFWQHLQPLLLKIEV